MLLSPINRGSIKDALRVKSLMLPQCFLSASGKAETNEKAKKEEINR